MKVCEKVQAKGTTTYNEVADELVNEFTESSRSQSPTDGINVWNIFSLISCNSDYLLRQSRLSYLSISYL